MTCELNALREFGVTINVADAEKTPYFGITVTAPKQGAYDAVILTVPQRKLVEQGVEALRAYGKESHVFYDMKTVYPADASDLRL